MAANANYATLLGKLLRGAGFTYSMSQGNLKYTMGQAGESVNQYSNMGVSSGKWYFEVYINTVGNHNYVGIAPSEAVSYDNNIAFTNQNAPGGMGYLSNGNVRQNNSDTSSGYNTYTDDDIIQVAMDVDNTKVWFGKNNTWQNSGDPANGTNASYTNWTGGNGEVLKTWHFGLGAGQSGRINTANFGQDDTFGGVITAAGNTDGNGFGVFKYAPPTGFLALCSANLPLATEIDPAETDDDFVGGKQFNPILWTGNGSTNNITGLGFQPDLVWTKGRSTTYNNRLWDSSRGVQKYLDSDSTDAEATLSTGLTAFGSDGFTLGSGGSQNSNGATYIAWCWRAKGGTETTNNDGNVTSYIQANTNAGFSIVRHSDSFGSSSSLGHGLGVKPDFFIHKLLADGTNMSAWHNGLSGANYIVRINTTAAEATSTHLGEPSSSVLNFGSGLSGTGAGISYCWHNVEGFQKFGSYIGNGNADGPFIYTGFRPRMFFIKNIGATSKWHVYDTARTTSNPMNDTLDWNANNAEQTNYAYQDYDTLSNGFKVRGDNGFANSSGVTYIYGAWGDVPFKYNNTF